MIDFIKNNKYILAALAILLIYLSPNIFFPSEAQFLIHDNLDSNVVWYKALGESGEMFGSNLAIIPNNLNGLPKRVLSAEFQLLSILYSVFSPLVAYNINIVLMHFLAFFSMYVFTRKYIFKFNYEWAVVLISLTFSLLPFWPSGGGTITAQPLLLFAFLNVFNREVKYYNWLIIFFFPFYSSLAFSNLFFILALSLLFLIYTIYKRKINFYFITALLLFVIASVIAEYRLFYMQFIEHFQNHRDILGKGGSLNLKGVLGVGLSHFAKGQYHYYTMQLPFVVLTSILAFVFAQKRNHRLIIFLSLCLIYLNSLLYLLPKWTPVTELMKSSDVLSSVALRFYSLSPLMWFLTFAFAVYVLLKRNDYFKFIFGFIGGFYVLYLFFPVKIGDYAGSKFIESSFYNTCFNPSDSESKSFNEYYKMELFKEIKTKVPNNAYVACLGMDPAIVQFNNYNTIDGYFYYYSKAYNDKMKGICKLENGKGKC